MLKTLIAAAFLWTALTSASAQVQPMQMMAQGQGWATDHGKLFWTNDDGSHWADITPHAVGYITDVFFVDNSHGWALFSSADQFSDVNSVFFTLARTGDAGKTWATAPVNVPDQKTKEFDGKAWLCFLDANHGWVVLHARSSVAATSGQLLATDDSGATWKELPRTPVSGRPAFSTENDGWIAAISANIGADLFRTRDGGGTWNDLGPVPGKLPPHLATSITLGELRFLDAKHGFLLVWLQPADQTEVSRGTALVLYVTEDGGNKWKCARVLSDSALAGGAPVFRGTTPNSWGNETGIVTKFAPMSRIRAAAVVYRDGAADPEMVVAVNDSKDPSRVTLVHVDQNVTKVATVKKTTAQNVLWRQSDGIAKLSFVSPEHGWARSSQGSLLLTVNGGTSWKDIRPIPMPRPSTAQPKTATR